MIRAIATLALALAAVVAAPTAASAAKHNGCYASEAKARKAHPTVRLKVTKKAGKRCWYASPVRAIPMPMPAPPNLAGEAPGLSTVTVSEVDDLILSSPRTQREASASRRGEPAPVSFAERFAEPDYIPAWQILIHVREWLRPDYKINNASGSWGW